MTDPIRLRASDLLSRATGRHPGAVVGFDGFIDTIAEVVDRRASTAPAAYEPFRSIADFGARIAGAAGRSANLEIRAREVRAGGNGPILAGALDALGLRVTLIGALGTEGSTDRIDPVYRPLTERCARAVSIAPAARTDALEFDDGKVMFNWPASLDGLDWDAVLRAIPAGELAAACASAGLLATVNWTNLGAMGSIWRGLRERVLTDPGAPVALFVDLSNPARRSDDALRRALGELASFPAWAPVTLGLNLAEGERLMAALALPGAIEPTPDGMARAAETLRSATGLHAIVLHTRGAVGAASDGELAAVRTRIVRRPLLSTGAGDHFNGGYLAARALGLGLEEGLACGCDTATRFVRTGRCPTRAELVEELRAPLSD
jgi:hypothetical protein